LNHSRRNTPTAERSTSRDRRRCLCGGAKPFRPYESRWENPVDEPTFRALAGKLAIAGEKLFRGIFERNKGTSLDSLADTLRAMAAERSFALTIYAPTFHIPRSARPSGTRPRSLNTRAVMF
jgi:hypothetical protein